MTDKPELIQAAQAIGTKIGELAVRMGLAKPAAAKPQSRKKAKQVKKKSAVKVQTALNRPTKNASAKKAAITFKARAPTKKLAHSKATRKSTRTTG